MADKKAQHNWDMVAWICFHMPRFSKQTRSLDDYNPLGKNRKQFDLTRLAELQAEMDLPKTLTNEEIEERWEEFKRKKEAGEL